MLVERELLLPGLIHVQKSSATSPKNYKANDITDYCTHTKTLKIAKIIFYMFGDSPNITDYIYLIQLLHHMSLTL